MTTNPPKAKKRTKTVTFEVPDVGDDSWCVVNLDTLKKCRLLLRHSQACVTNSEQHNAELQSILDQIECQVDSGIYRNN